MIALGIVVGVLGLAVMAYGGSTIYRVKAGKVSGPNVVKVELLGRRITYAGLALTLFGVVLLAVTAADIVS